MSEKILSIIVPSYNMEKYLPKCLGSLVAAPELMERLEVLVVNDGSKDRTSEIAHEFAARYPDVFRVIDKPNGNYGSCINAALPLITGRYVKILDADDYVRTEEFVTFLEIVGDCDADLVVSDFALVDESGKVRRTQTYHLQAEAVFNIAEVGDEINHFPIHAGCYNSRVFKGWKYHQLEGISYTDCQWICEPMLRVSSIRYIPRCVTCYLLGRNGQTMSSESRIKGIGQQITVDLYLARLHNEGRPSGCADGAWRYFERFLYSELGQVYRIAVFGCEGRFPSLRDIQRFDKSLRDGNLGIWKRLMTHPCACVKIAGRFRVNCVALCRCGLPSSALVLACRMYMSARRVLIRLGF